jgi:hypothetical protein
MFGFALATLLAATPAPKAEPAEVAALRAQADAVIRAASAQRWFVNDTRWDLPAVRHTQSGLRCLFQPGDAANRIIHVGHVKSGGGMGCISRPSGFTQTLSAVKMTEGDTLDTVFAGAVRDLEGAEARAYEGPRIVVRVEPAPGEPKLAEVRSGRYLVRKGEQDVFSLVSVALVDGWIIRQQFEAPAARAEDADMLAGVVMSTTLLDLAARKTAA